MAGYKCDKCNKTYCSKQYLKEHVCSAGESFCKDCNRYYKSKSALEKHKCSPYNCSICKKNFTSHTSHKYHTDKKCDICNAKLCANTYKDHICQYELLCKCLLCERIIKFENIENHKNSEKCLENQMDKIL